MRRLMAVFVAPFLVLFFVGSAFAPTDPIPHMINYQGMLTSNEGNPLNGLYDLTFRIYDVPEGGTALWTGNFNDEEVLDGLFNIILEVPASVFNGPDRYMGITVWPDAELTPRTRLTSVGYAYVAETAVTSGTDGDWTISDNHIYSAVSGNVGIGTTSPDYKLEIVGTPDVFKAGTSNAWITMRTMGNSTINFGDGDDGLRAGFFTGDENASGENVLIIAGCDDAGNCPRYTYFHEDGNVGIGVNNPSERLEIDGTAKMTGFKMSTGSSAGYVLTSDVSGVGTWQPAAGGAIGGSGTTNYIPKFTSSTTVGNSGIYQSGIRVGIGTTTPGAGLEVSAGGELYNPSIGIKNTDGNMDWRFVVEDDDDFKLVKVTGSTFSAITVNPNGDVGIGEQSSGAKLYVEETSYGRTLEVKNTYLGSIGQFVNFERTNNPVADNDMLQIKAPSGAPSGLQFIECERGTDIEFKVNGDGNVYADGSYSTPASDFAEMITVSSGAYTAEAGDVMVIDTRNPRAILRSSESRSTLVAGIYSTNPGFIGSGREWDKPSTGKEESGTYTLKEIAAEFNQVPLAVMGIVPCKVSAENGAISPGDLLVTSSIPGHAMRDENPKVGTVVGKALGSLTSDTGVIQVLVMLQ